MGLLRNQANITKLTVLEIKMFENLWDKVWDTHTHIIALRPSGSFDIQYAQSWLPQDFKRSQLYSYS